MKNGICRRCGVPLPLSAIPQERYGCTEHQRRIFSVISITVADSDCRKIATERISEWQLHRFVTASVDRSRRYFLSFVKNWVSHTRTMR